MCREDWTWRLNNGTVDEAWCPFRDTLIGFVEEHVPHRRTEYHNDQFGWQDKWIEPWERKRNYGREQDVDQRRCQLSRRLRDWRWMQWGRQSGAFKRNFWRRKLRKASLFMHTWRGEQKNRTTIGPLFGKIKSWLWVTRRWLVCKTSFFASMFCKEESEPMPDVEQKDYWTIKKLRTTQQWDLTK